MDSKVLARTGAAVFVGLAVAMTLVQLREEPAVRPEAATSIWEPDGDPLPAQLRPARKWASSRCPRPIAVPPGPKSAAVSSGLSTPTLTPR